MRTGGERGFRSVAGQRGTMVDVEGSGASCLSPDPQRYCNIPFFCSTKYFLVAVKLNSLVALFKFVEMFFKMYNLSKAYE